MSNTIKVKGGTGIGFTGLLVILFVGLKLTGYINWSWWWVLCPIWIWIALIILVAAFIFLIALITK